MPNSYAVQSVLTQDVLGAQSRNGLTDTYINMPNEDYDRMEEAAAAILERIARAVDWERLLTEAEWRHEVIHADGDPGTLLTAERLVCGDCLREALISEQRYSPNWSEHPHTPYTRQQLDWPRVVAEVLKYRDAASWHPYKGEEGTK